MKVYYYNFLKLLLRSVFQLLLLTNSSSTRISRKLSNTHFLLTSRLYEYFEHTFGIMHILNTFGIIHNN
jgi:hypothetical protein